MQAVQGRGIFSLTNGHTHVVVHLITCVCTAFCTCTPRLSSTLYSLLGLYVSVFLVVISPSTLLRVCRGSVPWRLLTVWSRGLWCVFVAWICLCALVPGHCDALTCGAIQAGPGHAHVPRLRIALTCGALQAGPGHRHVSSYTDAHLYTCHDTGTAWETARIYALIYMPGGMRQNFGTCPAPSLPFIEQWTAVCGTRTENA